MNKNKIAILVDSGSDVPKKLVEKYHMFVAPLKIIYGDKEYLDSIDITAQEVYDNIENSIPTTSLPDYGTIEDIFDKIKKEGYTHVFAVSISARLSGTNNLIRIVADDYEGLEIEIVDTKNISIGSGLIAIQIGEYINRGFNFDKIKKRLPDDISNTKVFFTIPTLKYLRAGGRIGHVASFIGEFLNLKPIISCDKEGVYHTIEKARGWKNAVNEVFKLANDYAETLGRHRAFYVYTNLDTDVYYKIKDFEEKFKRAELLGSAQLSPTLGVHTGPGLIGIAIQKIN